MKKNWIVLFTLLVSTHCFSKDRLYYMETLANRSENTEIRSQAKELNSIFEKLSAQAGVQSSLIYSSNSEINAFATEVNGEKIVMIYQGLLSKLENDRDAVAAVIGHELAHHKADHLHAGNRKKKGVRLFGALLGAVVGAKVGYKNGNLANRVSNNAVNFGANLVALKFNRNQEKDADQLSLNWMLEAGYNPNGMLRLQQMMTEMNQKNKRAALLSSHPTSKKRYNAAKKLIAQHKVPEQILNQSPMPLVSEQDKDSITVLCCRDNNMNTMDLSTPNVNTQDNISKDSVRIGESVRYNGKLVKSTKK